MTSQPKVENHRHHRSENLKSHIRNFCLRNVGNIYRITRKYNYCIIYLFICSFFNGVLSNSENIASNERVTSEWWIADDVEGNGRDLI
jgi:predicted DNA-binding ribbon-helix-helix protein